MAATPRASKRRKLESPSQTTLTPLTTRSTRKTSKAASSAKRSHNEPEDGVTTSMRKKAAALGAEETGGLDVWDDIEGALGESPSKRARTRPPISVKKQTPKKTVRKDSESAGIDQLASSATTPSRRTKRKTDEADTPSRALFRPIVNGHQHSDPLEVEAEVEAKNQDEPTQENVTPSRRRPGRPPKPKHTVQEPSPLKKATMAGRRRKTQDVEEEDNDMANTIALRSNRKRQSHFRDQSEVPETEDEVEPRRVSPPKSASVQRRKNRRDASSAVTGLGGEDDTRSVDGNSVLGSVLDPTEPSPFNKPSPATQKGFSKIPLLPTHLEPGRELDLLKTIVLERISAKRPAPLVGLDKEYQSVHQLVEHTVSAGEGNSMLVIGPRGSGKTALVNKVLSEVSKDNSQDYHVVRLNGFVHTDDKIALREIWRQLGKEMALEEEGGGVGKNYADTLATLLALLSHPSEHAGVHTEHVYKAVVFIMDEFDLFTYHPRQTLLYNLFDIAQARKAPIAVLGLSTRIDVLNSLEKRVKSRFSHRYVHLSLAKSFTTFQEMCKASLTVQPELLSIEERGILESTTHSKKSKNNTKSATTTALAQWNSNLDALFASKSFLTTHLAPFYYRSKSVPMVLNTFLLPTATLSDTLSLTSASLTTPPDSKLAVIPQLSTLALSLLIATARLDIIHDSDTCNFNMAYDEYVTLASKARIQNAVGGLSASGSIAKVWGKELARKEWEGLVRLKLILPFMGAQAGDFAMVKADVALEEIGVVVGGIKGLEKGLERWCKQI